MKVTFHGAARTTTGSMHLIEINGEKILLDCGIYQGSRKEAFERNRNIPFDAKSVSKVILSHAHMDHSGNLPSLVKRGFDGEIIATPATCDLCDIMLRDSAHIQEKDVEIVNRKRMQDRRNLFEPLYVTADVERTLRYFRSEPYGKAFPVAEGAVATFHEAGHLLGSAITAIDIDIGGGRNKRLLFTGDLGRNNMPILRDPVVVKDVNLLITESTYGNRVHPPMADVKGRLKAFIDDIYRQKAKLIIPSFAVGRTQEIVYMLHEIYEQGRIPVVPVFVDSPLSSKATEIFANHRECYDAELTRVIMEGDKPFQFKSLRYITETNDSKKLNNMQGPAIIISSSGMCEAGRILHHLRNSIWDPRNIILFVGYQAENTLGRKIVDHQSPIRIYGEDIDVNARVHTINALSAHADRQELLDYFCAMGPEVEKAFVVHGEVVQAEALAEGIRELGARDVVVPEMGQSFELF
ncbi:MAG: MBL fold metallo-hydrolase [Verrucomicrobia bacterium]|nr:MBL fold metallo-hydrolase [Verrucomicrobiota bacterium]